jgi:hypothetical protein
MGEINERGQEMGERGVIDRRVVNPQAFWMLYVAARSTQPKSLEGSQHE